MEGEITSTVKLGSKRNLVLVPADNTKYWIWGLSENPVGKIDINNIEHEMLREQYAVRGLRS